MTVETLNDETSRNQNEESAQQGQVPGKESEMTEQIEENVVSDNLDTDKKAEASSTNPSGELSKPPPELEAHPIAEEFPLLSEISESNWNEFVEDIKKNGLREPIVTLDGMLLDGRNRYAACRILGYVPNEIPSVPYAPRYDGDTPAAFVLSKNLHRRHLDLNPSQRAMLATRLANMRQGERTDLEPSVQLPKVSQAEAAKKHNVSTSLVGQAAVVEKHGTPEDKQAVMRGEKSVGEVSKKIRENSKANSDEAQRKTNVDSTEPASAETLEPMAQSDEQVLADFVPNEGAQDTKSAWWHAIEGTLYRRVEGRDITSTPLEMVQHAIVVVQRVVEENPFARLLEDLNEIQTLALAGGTELTEEAIESVLITEALDDAMRAIKDVDEEVLQTWSRIQEGRLDWTPFKGLPPYRKGKLDVKSIVKAITYVLLIEGWSTKCITETIIAIMGSDTG